MAYEKNNAKSNHVLLADSLNAQRNRPIARRNCPIVQIGRQRTTYTRAPGHMQNTSRCLEHQK